MSDYNYMNKGNPARPNIHVSKVLSRSDLAELEKLAAQVTVAYVQRQELDDSIDKKDGSASGVFYCGVLEKMVAARKKILGGGGG